MHLVANRESTLVQDDLKRAVLLQLFVGAKMETLMVASSGQSVLRVCAQFGNTVTTLEGSSYLIIILVVIIIITVCQHTLDWLLLLVA